MKKKISILILNLQIAIVSFCFSQINSKDIYSRQNFILIDSSYQNEMGLVCKLYSSKTASSLFLQVCYWDSLKTKVASKHFKQNGKYYGPCTYWTVDGDLIMEGSYFNDKKNGMWSYYFAKKISSRGKYKDGKRVGKWEEYDENGKLKKVKNYINN